MVGLETAARPRLALLNGNASERGPSADAEPTLVSLTFDDASSGQYAVRDLLRERSMRATFYVNSGRIGALGVMTWEQLSHLAADGNEIGGHTLNHVKLPSVSSWKARQEILKDRQALIAQGFRVTTFAYPFGAHNRRLALIVRQCGYLAARRSWGLRPIGATRAESPRPVAESSPAHDLWATRTVESIRTWHSFADIVATIIRAEAGGGGWVTLVFHRVGHRAADPDGYSVGLETLAALLDWLDRRAAYGTFVRPVEEVVSEMTGAVRLRARERRPGVGADIALGG